MSHIGTNGCLNSQRTKKDLQNLSALWIKSIQGTFQFWWGVYLMEWTANKLWNLLNSLFQGPTSTCRFSTLKFWILYWIYKIYLTLTSLRVSSSMRLFGDLELAFQMIPKKYSRTNCDHLSRSLCLTKRWVFSIFTLTWEENGWIGKMKFVLMKPLRTQNSAKYWFPPSTQRNTLTFWIWWSNWNILACLSVNQGQQNQLSSVIILAPFQLTNIWDSKSISPRGLPAEIYRPIFRTTSRKDQDVFLVRRLLGKN